VATICQGLGNGVDGTKLDATALMEQNSMRENI
jgi:hypothetical protein